jgi:tetratricopeptide (TPR) repeat protein
MAPIDWGRAALVLAAGLLLGAALVRGLRRSKSAEAKAPPPLELRDLDGRVESLLGQLRELDDAVGPAPERVAEERYALELDAARALLARERLARSLPRPRAAEAKVGADRAAAGRAARRRALFWGLGCAGAVVGLVALAWSTAGPRPEGGSVTGSVATKAAREADAEADLRAAVGRDPEDLEARLDLARHLLRKRDLMGVFDETRRVLSRSPGHPRALAYQALVRLARGEGDVAVAMLRQAVAGAPDLLEARQHLVFAYARLGRREEAEAAIAETARRFPGEAERLKQALAQLGAGAEAAGAPANRPDAARGR